MLRELIESAEEALRLPEIRGERCVHSFMENAQCRACVDACPKQAWILNDEMLGIDAQACDGCGLCAPVCPEGALLHEHEPVIRRRKGRLYALLACEHSPAKRAKQAVMPCVHVLGLRNLIDLYRQGCYELLVQRGACSQCPRALAEALDDRVQRLNALLEARGLTPIKLQTTSLSLWNSLLDLSPATTNGPQLSRRHFLRDTLMQGIEKGKYSASLLDAEQQGAPPLARLLPAVDGSFPLPFVIHIDSEKCNGCDACSRLCPHQSIRLAGGENDLHYDLIHQDCTHCGICEDVCDQQAVLIIEDVIPGQSGLPLHQLRCSACGAPFHRPESQEVTHTQCRICHQADHHRTLFQVLE